MYIISKFFFLVKQYYIRLSSFTPRAESVRGNLRRLTMSEVAYVTHVGRNNPFVFTVVLAIPAPHKRLSWLGQSVPSIGVCIVVNCDNVLAHSILPFPLGIGFCSFASGSIHRRNRLIILGLNFVAYRVQLVADSQNWHALSLIFGPTFPLYYGLSKNPRTILLS